MGLHSIMQMAVILFLTEQMISCWGAIILQVTQDRFILSLLAMEVQLVSPITVALFTKFRNAQIKGGGGGQKTLAVAGGQDAAALMSAIDAVKKAMHA